MTAPHPDWVRADRRHVLKVAPLFVWAGSRRGRRWKSPVARPLRAAILRGASGRPITAHPDWVRAEGVRADRLIRTRADGWHLVVERLPSGVWIAATHRGDPDDWASLGRHDTEAAALAAADGWEPTAPRQPLRLSAPVLTAEPEPEPDDDEPEPEPDDEPDTTPAEPISAPADPRQLSLWSRP